MRASWPRTAGPAPAAVIGARQTARSSARQPSWAGPAPRERARGQGKVWTVPSSSIVAADTARLYRTYRTLRYARLKSLQRRSSTTIDVYIHNLQGTTGFDVVGSWGWLRVEV